ncbi:hypothetical protein CRE_23685 [Caenorhabditis remanei]|uniref:Uncharacterized protein n=1 Tax=Caenorhabditis remanei TaxID=31234 RepID=E3N4B6_CAERE|nr:hypothetical protein CRE_23685 [Caenorhabditis remanei]
MAANNESFPLELFETLIRQNYSYGGVLKKMKISANSDVKELYTRNVDRMICMEKDPMYATITIKNQDQFLSELRELWEQLKKRQEDKAERKRHGDCKIDRMTRRMKQLKVRKIKALQEAIHIPKGRALTLEEIKAWRAALANRKKGGMVDGKEERQCKRCHLVIRF